MRLTALFLATIATGVVATPFAAIEKPPVEQDCPGGYPNLCPDVNKCFSPGSWTEGCIGCVGNLVCKGGVSDL
jgi:hypothetical protein